jgi:hypothetical protein
VQVGLRRHCHDVILSPATGSHRRRIGQHVHWVV